jgi:hypothetical protein
MTTTVSSRWVLLGVALLFGFVFCGALLFPLWEGFAINGPSLFLGQLAADRSSRRMPQNQYESVELVAGAVPSTEIVGVDFVWLREDVLFGGHPYLGFARTRLASPETAGLLSLLESADWALPSDSASHLCFDLESLTPSACPEAEGLADRFFDIKFEAEARGTVAVVQFALTRDRMAEVRLWWTEDWMAISPEGNAPWLMGVARAEPSLRAWQDRAGVPTIPILWPDLDAAGAKDRAARRLGAVFDRALLALQRSESLRATLGALEEIRPAAGVNQYSSWMDSTSADLTFRAVGPNGEAVVLVRGYECFDIEFVFQGIIHDDSETVCS